MRINIDETDHDFDGDFLYQGQYFTGELVETGPDGQIIELSTVKDGRFHGLSQGWHLNGKLKYRGESIDGRAIGEHTEWYANGNIAGITVFNQEGELLSKHEWDENGIPLPYRVNSRYVYLNEDETLYMHGNMVFSGESFEALADGRVTAITTIRRGLKDGPYRTWYASGQLKSEGQHHKGVPTGIHLEWHENGQSAHEIIYNEHGQIFSVQKWDEQGNLLAVND